ncbi:HAD family hydrolase [Streptomyces spiramyceticus]|uniref:HAD family hydrolase n=1 Tax=Streptomyces spiramyceticus TaxID=299717 RepID=UPI00237B9650|nr:HAD family phosphatase [Streptomyces spiramyceticus]
MTSDATQTGQAASVIEKVRDLITGAECVLFDFDGPICRLFAGHQAHRVADSLVDWLEKRGRHVLLTEEELGSDDPQDVLKAVARMHPGSDLVEALEEKLTREELRAAATARPTPYADPLIRTWRAVGSRLAITTNNSPLVAEQYLTGRGLADCFRPHIYGRTTDLDRLKPAPDCLNRALTALGARPAASLMIGDTPSDLIAARRAGVRFLGYGRDQPRMERLRKAGAATVVDDLGQVLHLVRKLGRA